MSLVGQVVDRYVGDIKTWRTGPEAERDFIAMLALLLEVLSRSLCLAPLVTSPLKSLADCVRARRRTQHSQERRLETNPGAPAATERTTATRRWTSG